MAAPERRLEMFGLFAPILGVLPAEVNFFTGWAQAMNVGAIVLLIVGVILLICEMLIPGIGVAGVCGVIACVAGLIVGSDSIAQAAFTLAILLVILLIAALIIFKFIFGKRKKQSKLILNEEISRSDTDEARHEASLVGKEGVALTMLRPSGIAEIDGKRIDVVADGDFISKGEGIVVTQAEGIRILVKKK